MSGAAIFHLEFREDLRYWVKPDRNSAIRVLDLVEGVIRDPFEGSGKPEPLRYILAVSDAAIDFLQARYHRIHHTGAPGETRPQPITTVLEKLPPSKPCNSNYLRLPLRRPGPKCLTPSAIVESQGLLHAPRVKAAFF